MCDTSGFAGISIVTEGTTADTGLPFFCDDIDFCDGAGLTLAEVNDGLNTDGTKVRRSAAVMSPGISCVAPDMCFAAVELRDSLELVDYRYTFFDVSPGIPSRFGVASEVSFLTAATTCIGASTTIVDSTTGMLSEVLGADDPGAGFCCGLSI